MWNPVQGQRGGGEVISVALVFQKHNFPVNYTIRVHAYELLRLSNISRMVTNPVQPLLPLKSGSG